MTKFESPNVPNTSEIQRESERKQAEDTKTALKMARFLSEKGHNWGGNKLNELTPEIALATIIQAASEQGGIDGVGNLENTLIQIVRPSAPDADINELKTHQDVVEQPSTEDILSALEKLVNNKVDLTPDLEDVYLENLELHCTKEIEACEQDPDCINNILTTASERAISINIEGGKINNFRSRIEVWAYNQEAA